MSTSKGVRRTADSPVRHLGPAAAAEAGGVTESHWRLCVWIGEGILAACVAFVIVALAGSRVNPRRTRSRHDRLWRVLAGDARSLMIVTPLGGSGAEASGLRLLSVSKATPIRVLLADDEELVRAGIKLILRHANDVDVIAEAADGAQAVAMIGLHVVDVVLMDIRMPRMDGLAAIREISRTAPDVQVVMLTTFGDQANVEGALRAGAAGFVLKDIAPAALIQTVRVAAAGQAVLAPGIARQLVTRNSSGESGSPDAARARIAGLTERERMVVVQVGSGLSNGAIARRLHLSEGTVKTHISRILTKLRCDSRVQIAILAHDAGILPDRTM